MAERTEGLAVELARAFIEHAACEEEEQFLTHLQIHKLLYYAQGWRLAIDGAPFFAEGIEAWSHGPVVPAVWKHFDGTEHGFPTNTPDAPSELDDARREFASRVWATYRDFSPNKLREMTKSEPPWLDARGETPACDRCSAPISVDALREYFESIHDESSSTTP